METTQLKENTQTKGQIILDIRDLKVNFYTYEGTVKALDGINLKIFKGESFGLVGETGCGKSVTVRSIMRLIEEPGKIVGGEIYYNNEDVLKFSEKKIRSLRGRKITMIFQDPMTFLNPVLKVGDQVSEVILIHQKIHKDILDDKEDLAHYLRSKVVEIFERVSLPDAES
ncbi:MAG: ATP-binding cassette domain-containing protein, partial [Candidatus Hodarchaeales archaeon]